ncbi:hypothetical protein [Streptomyces sp. NPDC005533]
MATHDQFSMVRSHAEVHSLTGDSYRTRGRSDLCGLPAANNAN